MSSSIGQMARCHVSRSVSTERILPLLSKHSQRGFVKDGKVARKKQEREKALDEPRTEQVLVPELKFPIATPIERMLRYDDFKARLDKLNREVSSMSKAQAETALLSFLGVVTRLGLSKIKDSAATGFQLKPNHAGGKKWKACMTLYQDSKRWWKENEKS